MSEEESEPQMKGYLYKKAASGKWQRRWFETNSHYLTYYKSRQTEKLLAALNLPHVGEIKLSDDDMFESQNVGCCFSIELNTRVYLMRAESREEALQWVEVLKELQRSDIQKHKHSESPHARMMDRDEVKHIGVVSYLSHWEKTGSCLGMCGCMRIP